MTRVATPAALAAVVAMLVVGCTAPARLAALDDGEAASCTPADAQGRAAFGLSGIENATAGELVVVGAELIGAEGVELLGLELRPMQDESAHIVGLDYEAFGPAAIREPIRVPAGASRVVLVGLRLDGAAAGSAQALRLET